jgi:hypothetical protein
MACVIGHGLCFRGKWRKRSEHVLELNKNTILHLEGQTRGVPVSIE